MEENLENFTQQTEEMEALTSIYGDEWKIDDKTGICSIQLTKSIILYITLVPEYPSKTLPKYELLAPGLSTNQKHMVDKEFKNIFDNGDGGPLIYQMISAVEEIVNQHNNIFNENLVEATDLVENNDLIIKISDLTIKDSADLKITHGPIVEDRKSVFQGHVCAVVSKEDVSKFMEKLLENRKIAHATHNITAYRILMPNNVVLQDCDDDGEHKASGRILDLLQTLKLSNIMVVVSRWYGGVHLGPDRFRHINNAARQAIVAGGFLKT